MKRLLAIFMTLCMVLGLSGVNVWATEEATWQAEKPMSYVRSEGGACEIDGKIYLIGGRNYQTYSNKVEIYDTKNNTWTKGISMPEAIYGFTTSVVGDKIYIIGGKSKDINNKMLIYDTKVGAWSEGKPMLNPRLRFTSAVIGNKIYVMGGRNTLDNPNTINKVEIYDTKTETWTKGADMPTARMGLTSCVVGNNIYVFGGEDRVGALDTFEIYNAETDSWVTEQPMGKARAYQNSCVIGNKIYVLGGNGEEVINDVDIYIINEKKWEKGPSFTTKKQFSNTVIADGKIYRIGGSYNEEYFKTMESLKVADVIDPAPQKKLSTILNVFETTQLSTSYNLADNTNLTWSSTNEAVATVDANGKVTAVGEGQADIYAQNSDGTFKEFTPVKVIPNPDNIIRLAANIKAGEKLKLHLADDPSQVAWSSMNENIATVSSIGEVTAVKRGFVIIQGEFEEQTYQVYVRVN